MRKDDKRINLRVSESFKEIIFKTAQECCQTANDWIESIIWNVIAQGGIDHPTLVQADDVRAMFEPADDQFGFCLSKETFEECDRMAKNMGINMASFVNLAILINVADFNHHEVTLGQKTYGVNIPLGRKFHRYKYIDVFYKALERFIRKEKKRT